MINHLSNSKVFQKGEIKMRIVKNNKELFYKSLTACFNDAFDKRFLITN